MKTLLQTTLITAMAAALAACGGGDDEGGVVPPVPQQPSSIRLADPANSYLNARTAAAYTYFGSRDTYSLYAISLFSVIAAGSQAGPGNFSSNCTGGGTASITFDDRDGSGSISAGDTASMTFANCQENVELAGATLLTTLNGGMSFVINAASGPTANLQDFSFVAAVTANNLSAQAGTASMTFNGTMTISKSIPQPDSTLKYIATSNDVTVNRNINGVQDSIMLAGWRLDDALSLLTFTDEVKLSGNLNFTTASGNENLLLTTTSPLVVGASGVPSAGSVAFATTQDQASASFASTGDVALAIDAGKTGTVSATLSTTISALESLFGN
ncbi:MULTISPECIES: hypothetical protein [Ralstonia]|uniref:hypothetical protein n=1 Tax=Ralstonia TaxID=48736 RepID=UPI0021B277A6|nr:hypothetical protein [Ralstonia wenshanensis]MCT7306671.1 hypothetical protein [Ralstonia wenshanensis]